MRLPLTIALLAFTASLALADAPPSKAARIERLLNEAQTLSASGRYEQASVSCDQALNIDPFSIAARSLRERILHTQTVADAKKRGDTEAEVFHPTYPSQRVGPLPGVHRLK